MYFIRSLPVWFNGAFSDTYDSQEERKDKILYPYSRQVTKSMTLTKQCPFR